MRKRKYKNQIQKPRFFGRQILPIHPFFLSSQPKLIHFSFAISEFYSNFAEENMSTRQNHNEYEMDSNHHA